MQNTRLNTSENPRKAWKTIEHHRKTFWKARKDEGRSRGPGGGPILRGGGLQWYLTRFVARPPSLTGKENLLKQELLQLAALAFVNSFGMWFCGIFWIDPHRPLSIVPHKWALIQFFKAAFVASRIQTTVQSIRIQQYLQVQDPFVWNYSETVSLRKGSLHVRHLVLTSAHNENSQGGMPIDAVNHPGPTQEVDPTWVSQLSP